MEQTLKQQLRNTFLETIAINEIYPNEKEIIEYCEKRFADAGVSVERDSFNNLVVKISGTGEPVFMSSHLDIPEPNPDVRYTEEGDIIAADGTNILGADPKSGLAILVDLACDYANRDHATHRPIEMLLTRGEETGLYGAINADYSMFESKMGIVLDEDGPVTQVVTQAPAFVRLDATFKGKIVHPREPEKGVNALQMAAEAMTKVPCGYSTEGVTWNIGMFESGTARNSVPGTAVAKGELRSFDQALVESEAERIKKTFEEVAEQYGGSCEVELVTEFGAYKLDGTHPLFDLLEATFEAMDLKPNYFETFGGTDANIFNQNGIMCVPLGSGYYNAHEYTEYVNLAEMEEIYRFLEKMVEVR